MEWVCNIAFALMMIGGLYLVFNTAVAAYMGEKLGRKVCAMFGFWAAFFAFVKVVARV